MSDTPETQEAVERWRQGKINIFDEMARLERERNEARRGIRLMAQNAEVWKEKADEARDHAAMWEKVALREASINGADLREE